MSKIQRYDVVLDFGPYGDFAIMKENLNGDYVTYAAHASQLAGLGAERDAAQGVLASLTDALNTYCREDGVEETRDYLTLAVRDGLDRLVFAMRRKGDRLRAERDNLQIALDIMNDQSPVLEAKELRAEVDALKASRGRCKKHMNEPGPSLYHDCCESERLRELVREQAAHLTRLQSEKSAAVEVLESERARLREFAAFIFDQTFDGCDVDGGSVQDKAVELGVLVEAPGGFDPERDDDSSGAAEPGCTWYVPAWSERAAALSGGAA